MNAKPITATGFLNDSTERASLGRLGGAALYNGVSSGAVRALVALTCQAHGVPIPGLHCRAEEGHLAELAAAKLIHRVGDTEIKLV